MSISFAAKTIAVYSVAKKAGKSTVARELSGFYQIGGKKTLLVDFTYGKSKILKYMSADGYDGLSEWVEDIARKLREHPWYEIKYKQEEVSAYVYQHSTGLGILSCRAMDKPQKMLEITGVMLQALSGCDYDVIVFDLEAGLRDYLMKVLGTVDTVLLVTDTFRYDVMEVREALERLQEANIRTDHFKLLFNKKPSFLDETPSEVSGELHMPIAGTLPDYPDLNNRLQYNLDSINEYSKAMAALTGSL